MTPSTRRWVISAVLVALVFFGGNMLIAYGHDTRAVARQWAGSLSPSQKFAAFEQVETLRPEYQRELYYRFKIPEFARAMQERYTRLLQHRNLTPEQVDVVQELIALWAQYTDRDALDALRPEAEALQARAKAVLGKDIASLFTFNDGRLLAPKGTIGGGEVAYALPVSTRIKQVVADAAQTLAVALHAFGDFDPYGSYCNCNRLGGYCPDSIGGVPGYCNLWANSCAVIIPTGGDGLPCKDCLFGCTVFVTNNICDAVCNWTVKFE